MKFLRIASRLLFALVFLAASAPADSTPTCLSDMCDWANDTTCVSWRGPSLSPTCVTITVIVDGVDCVTLGACPPTCTYACNNSITGCTACFSITNLNSTYGCNIQQGKVVKYRITECSGGAACTTSGSTC